MTIPSYPALLALHLLAVGLFAGGLMMVAFALPGFGDGSPPGRDGELRRLARINRFAVTPALGCVWLLGITLATEGGWFAAPWLQTKIVLVVALSAIHGLQSGRLRRLIHGPGKTPRIAGWWPLLVGGIVLAILLLAGGKPALWQ